MPLHWQDAPISDADSDDFNRDCRRACLKMNASLWYAVWNDFGTLTNKKVEIRASKINRILGEYEVRAACLRRASPRLGA